MKNLYLNTIATCAMILCCVRLSKAQEVDFTYDAAGNQTTREWVCVGCTTYSQSPFFAAAPVSLMTDTKDNKGNPTKKRTLVAYPNPVTEILNLKWDDNTYYIQSVAVSSVSGASVYTHSYPYVEGQQQINIPFSNLAPGMYVINVVYSDAKLDNVRVIKINR